MSKPKRKTAKKYVVSGRVHGVGFRYFAERWANLLGLTGYVKNLWDGTVEVYAIGDQAGLEEFKRQLAAGPRSAHVTNVMESEETVSPRHAHAFRIEEGW